MGTGPVNQRKSHYEPADQRGVEAWQVLKTAGDEWKILSIVWSSNGAPK
jgi:hypothetical protein